MEKSIEQLTNMSVRLDKDTKRILRLLSAVFGGTEKDVAIRAIRELAIREHGAVSKSMLEVIAGGAPTEKELAKERKNRRPKHG